MSTNSFAKTGSAAWWLTLLKGILLVVFGVWLIQSPSENLFKLSLIFGLLILSGGLLEVNYHFN